MNEWIYLDTDEYLCKNFRAVVNQTEKDTEELHFYGNHSEQLICSFPCAWGKHEDALAAFDKLVKASVR